MVKKIAIKKLNITFVFRHRLEKNRSQIKSLDFFNKWRFGIWFNKQQILAKNKKTRNKRFQTVNDYMFGIDLLLISAWISIDCGGYHLDYDFYSPSDRHEK